MLGNAESVHNASVCLLFYVHEHSSLIHVAEVAVELEAKTAASIVADTIEVLDSDNL